MFDLFDVLFPILFLLIFVMVILSFAKGISTWFKNNNSPRLTVFATVVANTSKYDLCSTSSCR